MLAQVLREMTFLDLGIGRRWQVFRSHAAAAFWPFVPAGDAFGCALPKRRITKETDILLWRQQ
jgi:hypothetical protein